MFWYGGVDGFLSAFVAHLEVSDMLVHSMDVLIPASNVAAAVIALVSKNIFADVIPPVDRILSEVAKGVQDTIGWALSV